jgi:hypothetical protein
MWIRDHAPCLFEGGCPCGTNEEGNKWAVWCAASKGCILNPKTKQFECQTISVIDKDSPSKKCEKGYCACVSNKEKEIPLCSPGEICNMHSGMWSECGRKIINLKNQCPLTNPSCECSSEGITPGAFGLPRIESGEYCGIESNKLVSVGSIIEPGSFCMTRRCTCFGKKGSSAACHTADYCSQDGDTVTCEEARPSRGGLCNLPNGCVCSNDRDLDGFSHFNRYPFKAITIAKD